MIPKLKIDGHFYAHRGSFQSKSNAVTAAKVLRKLGHNARVVRKGGKWSVYTR